MWIGVKKKGSEVQKLRSSEVRVRRFEVQGAWFRAAVRVAGSGVRGF
jgi:hypothetical protein